VEYGCPLCNGIAGVNERCSSCGQLMRDAGMVEDYYGPYSPYDNMDRYEPPLFWELADRMPCVHLFSCSKCGYDKRVGIQRAFF